MPRSDSAATTAPEEYLESDNLSNWGSDRSGATRADCGATGDEKGRPRRMSAPSSAQAPLGAASSRTNRSAKARDGSQSSSTSRGAVLGTISRDGRQKVTQRDTNGDNRPAWNVSTKLVTKGSTRRPQEHSHTSQALVLGLGGAKNREKGGEEVARGAGRAVHTRRKPKRASLGSVGSIGGGPRLGRASEDHAGSGGDPGGGDGGEDSRDSSILQEDDESLGSIAPTQEEIRVMIERIRLQTKDVLVDPEVRPRERAHSQSCCHGLLPSPSTAPTAGRLATTF